MWVTIEDSPEAAAAFQDDPDRGVLERVATGDLESFGVLVQRHQDRLVRLCERMLGRRDEAEEAAQDIFLKAFRKAGSYRPRGQVYTWLYRIAVNHCLNILRRRRVVRFFSFGDMGSRDDEGAEDGSPGYDPQALSPDAMRQLESKRRWILTRGLIDRLPAGQRAVLVLIKLEGLSYRQTAETLGITEGAVESRLFRAMRTLTRAQDGGPQDGSPQESGS